MAQSKIDTALESVDKTIDNAQNFAQDALLVLAALVIGLLLAYIAKYIISSIVIRLDFLFKHVSVDDEFKREKVKNNYARILGGATFAVIFLLTLEVCSHIIGWTLFTIWVEKLGSFIPRVITSLLIILSGFLIGNIAANLIEKTGSSFEVLHIKAIAQMSKFIIIITLFLVGIEQLGVSIGFLTTFIAIISGVLLSGLTVAFSLGARTFVANIIGAQQARKQCRIGDVIEINSIKGQVLDITRTEVLLDTSIGKAVIPAKLFSEQVVMVSSTSEDGESLITNIFKRD